MTVDVLIKRMEAIMDWNDRRYEACARNAMTAFKRGDTDLAGYWDREADRACKKSNDVHKALLMIKEMAGV